MGSVDSIETFGLVDGPGIRTVIFLNGCKLRCKYCHNPEMWNLSKNNISASDLVQKIIKNKPYFKRNNGGVTFSGGEPLLQSEFIIEVSKLLKKEDIHIALDTAGVGIEKLYDEILDLVDLVILDIKHIEPNAYKELTGINIDFFNTFKERLIKHNNKLWIRQVIVPGIHDNVEYIKSLREYLKQFSNIEKVEFLPYHKLGREKYLKLNIPYPLEQISEMDKEECKKLYEEFVKL